MDGLLSHPWLEKTTTEIDQDCATMEENVNKIHSELMIALDNYEDHWLVNNTLQRQFLALLTEVWTLH
jgi:hypothetical protein